MLPNAIRAALPRGRRAALAVPTFHKIWLATFATVSATSLLASYAAASLRLPVAAQPAVVSAAAAACAFGLHLLLLRLALRPFALLAGAAERVAGGDDAARAPVSVLADAQTRRTVQVFNDALDRVAREREHLRALAARARDVHEADRQQTAQRLHESAAQLLAGLLIHLQVARRTSDPDQREAALDAIRRDAAGAAEALQRIAFGLRPPALEEVGVANALESYARGACAEAGVALGFTFHAAAGDLPQASGTALFRIVQEAIDNALRHGGAGRLRLHGAVGEGAVEVWVRDDGRGFRVADTLEDTPCLGLLEMEQRAERIGGSVTVSSAPGAGTEVHVRLPLQVVPGPSVPRRAAAAHA